MLSHLFEHVYPQLPPDFEFDVLSGSSVGAVHAAYTGSSSQLEGRRRSRQVVDPWMHMSLKSMLRVSVGDVLGVPMRALGLRRLRRRRGSGADVLGGLVDIEPLERLVSERVPWDALRANLASGRAGALCVSCTEIRSGRVTVFMDGRLADPTPWAYDPNAQALHAEIDARHVRASAAIPFLFPAVRIGERYYVDGGLRMNTPLSPALRLGCSRVLVVGLKKPRPASDALPAYPEEVITQPVFLLGKVLDALLLDQLEYEVQRIHLVNALIQHGTRVFGPEFLDRINVAVRDQRGVDYRWVDSLVIRPSEDLGKMAAACYRGEKGRGSLGALPGLLARWAQKGGPDDEADLLSYLFFDRCFTRELVELGRQDTRRRHDEILALLAGDHPSAVPLASAT